MKKKKLQPFKQTGVILQILSPDQKHVTIIPVNEFMQYEANPLETDYCTIIGNSILISSKAKYDRVNVHQAPLELINK